MLTKNSGDLMFFILRDLACYPLIGFVFKYLYRIYNILYGASVPLNVVVDKSIRFPHGIHGVFISKDARLGKDIVIYHQVTVGSIQDEMHIKFGAPTIGDNCIIGVGAKVIGKVNIGNGVKIASNVSVSQDIQDNATVTPARNRIII